MSAIDPLVIGAIGIFLAGTCLGGLVIASCIVAARADEQMLRERWNQIEKAEQQ